MGSPQTALRRPDAVAWAVLAGIAVFVSGLLLLPLGALAWTTLSDLGRVATELSTETALHAMKMSAIVAVITVVCNGVFGVAGAIVVVRHRFFGRSAVDALVASRSRCRPS